MQKKYDVAIVILNYLNYKDTIECVESIKNMNYGEGRIIIVDNGSSNESYSELQKHCGMDRHVVLLKSKENVGFARGNNIGISFARKNNADFVLVVNNDTIFTDPNYISALVKSYKAGIGVIGSKIILKSGKEQDRIKGYIGLKDSFYNAVNGWTYLRGSSFDFPTRRGSYVDILHGSALLFTPDFFRYYKGFYPKTFLYGEEEILYLMCACKNLRQRYVDEVSIYHKEDMSSLMSFNNSSDVMMKYASMSAKYIFYWALRFSLYKKEARK